MIQLVGTADQKELRPVKLVFRTPQKRPFYRSLSISNYLRDVEPFGVEPVRSNGEVRVDDEPSDHPELAAAVIAAVGAGHHVVCTRQSAAEHVTNRQAYVLKQLNYYKVNNYLFIFTRCFTSVSAIFIIS